METVAGIEVELEHWPLIVVRPLEQVNLEDLETFFDFWSREISARPEPHALLLDLRQTEDMPSAQRKRLTDEMKAHQAQTARDRVACAMVFKSLFLRGILKAVMWASSPQYPTQVFGSVIGATAWLEGMLKQSLNRSRDAVG